jgi:hypothetical protein
MKEDKWVAIRSQIESGLHKKYAEVSLSETDLSVLSDTYELVQQNKLVRQHLEKWDVDDVFTLVLSLAANNNGDEEAVTKSLMEEWPKLTIDEVVASNVWYNTNTSKDVAPWVRQNLEMSHKFILESCDDDLRVQITDILMKFELPKRGGPLTFKVLMDLVQVNSERAIKHLIYSVKNMDVKNFDGESVIDAVAQLRGAHSRLKMVSFGSSNSAIPVTFNEDVMDVLQTTSTEEFNAAFNYRRLRAANRLMKNNPFAPTFDEILDAAIDLYNQMVRDNSWLGSKHKAKETAFNAKINPHQSRTETKKKITCWNCGIQGHTMEECRKPSNPEKQAQLREAWSNSRNPNRGGGG